MGRDNLFTGAIEIDPPLPWSKIRGSEFLPTGRRATDVRFGLNEECVDTDDGVLTKTTAVTIEPVSSSGYSGYKIVHDLQLIADTHPGHTFSGHIERLNRDQGDQSRYRIIDGKAVEFTPEVVWPQESE